MKEYKKSKSIYILPIVLLLILLIAIILMYIYLRKNPIHIILISIALPSIFSILLFIRLILFIKEPINKLSITNEGIFIYNHFLSYKEIDYVIIKSDALNLYFPYILVVCKDNTGFKITHIKELDSALIQIKKRLKG